MPESLGILGFSFLDFKIHTFRISGLCISNYPFPSLKCQSAGNENLRFQDSEFHDFGNLDYIFHYQKMSEVITKDFRNLVFWILRFTVCFHDLKCQSPGFKNRYEI